MNRFYQNLPESRGTLHRPELERDACGVGVVGSIHGERSNRVLRYGLTSCCNVVHRGAVDADQKTGDGAGVTTQIPYKVLLPDLEAMGCSVESPEELGVGVFFLTGEDAAEQLKVKILAEGVLRNRGVSVFGWREVPTNNKALGEIAKSTKPEILHLLLGRPEGMNADDYERVLYIARREIKLKAEEEGIRSFYICSISCRLISYKALLVAPALEKFYLDLQNPDFETAICLYHQRFSTNTFPTWPLAQPFRMLAHNGEINTLKGNRNWMRAREVFFESEVWGKDVRYLRDVLDHDASDSASIDSTLELLIISGRSLAHSMSMLVPPAWRIDPSTTEAQENFYRYHSCFSEPWDGPAALVFTDGRSIAASLDRNGLRPVRYKITEDGIFSLGSEVGVIELDDATVTHKGRLGPGQMIVVHTEEGRVVFDEEIKNELAAMQPYGKWIEDNRILLRESAPHIVPAPVDDFDPLGCSQRQIAFGYTKEDIDMILRPMLEKGVEPTYSMGDDVALSVLARTPRLLFTYFKQLFAQVTNPPIDPIRELLVMSVGADLGPERNFLGETPEHARVIHLESPFLLEHELVTIETLHEDFPVRTIDITWPVSEGAAGLDSALDSICAQAEKEVDDGARVLVLSDRVVDHERVSVPSLLATAAVHHHLVRVRKRMATSIVVESGEPRDTHQMACLIGFGATAICPYLAYETVREITENDSKNALEGLSYEDAVLRYISVMEKGVLKIMSKMGISVLNSYQGAQIFEAVGLNSALMGRCFPGTPSQIEGIGIEEVAGESIARHQAGFGRAFPAENVDEPMPLKLGDPGYNRPRRDGERHAMTGEVIKPFHAFVRNNDPDKYEDYVRAVLANQPVALNDLLEVVPLSSGPVPIGEVEPVKDILRRFTTAAMSLGALSPEAHETLAIAMNRIGGKSNSGEGGEEFRRFKHYPNGDWGNSKIKQVASGRFGVSAEYLASAEEIEIKMAQGAKPGEGGQLPGHKVNALIARLRHTQPGVQLISPPPHHDIYSIEDLAQLIHDLKEVNPRARVCVKLVAETGVGTIAAGVAKANADIILISGHDGGTGASPLSSIKHAGLPWEIGLAETQQVLMLNALRDRVTLRTDGGLRTGIDIIKAAIIGAEEFNFGTIAMIAMGCVYVRKCHLNTCPVGVATQDPKYRAKFKGEVEHVVNFFNAIAQEVREIMASIGVRKLDELIGHPGLLRQRHVPDHPKANLIDLSRLLCDVAAESGEDLPRICRINRNDGMHAHPLDDRILQDAHDALRDKERIALEYDVVNTNRNVGTKLSGEIAYEHGNHGLPEGTIDLKFNGSAGQSFGTFLVSGVRMTLTGEANDYVGKGMCGGEIIIRPPEKRKFVAAENAIMGNTVMYGATGGHLFGCGTAGERFCVRNSGGIAVIEGIGDHGCEYMTNGVVVILGRTGKNFGAGMSGGTAFVLDAEGDFGQHYNPELIDVVAVDDAGDIKLLQGLIHQHLEYTDSERANEILLDWDNYRRKFVKTRPKSTPAPPPGDDDEQAAGSEASEPDAVASPAK
ncbi:MAG: glutamate synthase large subunit [Verrucomicrobiales bacterium]